MTVVNIGEAKAFKLGDMEEDVIMGRPFGDDEAITFNWIKPFDIAVLH